MGGSDEYPRRHWYVAARAADVGSSLLPVQVCGERLVVYRTADGTPVALADRCSHRQFPLSAGQLVGDEVQCGYHGLRFDAAGRCTWAPGQERIPSRANVATRPVVERGPWLWMWMGPPDDPDHDALPAIPWCSDSRWATVDGMEPLAAHYGLLVDNLLDLSHETFLHAGSIGTPEVAETPIETGVAGDGRTPIVRVCRRMQAVECPPFYSDSTGLRTPIDRWQDIEYHPPGFYLLHVRVAPAGDATEDHAAHVKVLYAITPVDARHTLDFWAVARDFAIGDPKVDEFLADMNRRVVQQDVAALALLQERLDEQPDVHEVSFKIDAGGLAARRVLRDLVAAEAG